MRLNPPLVTNILLLWAVILFPSAGMMLFGAPSMAPGLLLASGLVLVAEAVASFRRKLQLQALKRILKWLILAVAIVVAHASLVNLLWGQIDWVRLVGSLISIGLVVAAGVCMKVRMLRHSPNEVHKIIVCTAYMLIVLAIRSIIGPPVFSPITHQHPVVVFIEPSHFALAFLPFLGYLIIQVRGWWRWLVLGASGALSISLTSTTLIAGLGVMLAMFLPWRQLLVIAIVCLGLGAAADFDPTFIVNRIVFSEEVRNLSNLVLIQGWERAYLSLQETFGLGLGFQQFGIWGPQGEWQDVIYGIAGEYLNLNDGGTTATKLIAEFGVFGIVLLLLFILWMWRSFQELRPALSGVRLSPIYVLQRIALIAVTSELFIRGVGYLSPSLILLIFSISLRDERVGAGKSIFRGRGRGRGVWGIRMRQDTALFDGWKSL